MTTTINVKGTGSTDGITYGGGSFCHQCGWTITSLDEDHLGDTSCDACGADLSLNTGIPATKTPAHGPAPAAGVAHPEPPPPAAADESPCDSVPKASATKAALYTYLRDAWGYTAKEIGDFTKAELRDLVVENCG